MVHLSGMCVIIRAGPGIKVSRGGDHDHSLGPEGGLIHSDSWWETSQKHTHWSRSADSERQIHVSAAAEPRLAGLRMRSRAPGELPGAGSTIRKEMMSHWWEFFVWNCVVHLHVNHQELLGVTEWVDISSTWLMPRDPRTLHSETL